MVWNIGVYGLGILLLLSVIFAVVAQIVFWKTSRWMWLIGGGTYFISGLFVSEVLFGTATEDQIQPIIDGLALDESGLFGFLIALAAVLITWFLIVRVGPHRPTAIRPGPTAI